MSLVFRAYICLPRNLYYVACEMILSQGRPGGGSLYTCTGDLFDAHLAWLTYDISRPYCLPRGSRFRSTKTLISICVSVPFLLLSFASKSSRTTAKALSPHSSLALIVYCSSRNSAAMASMLLLPCNNFSRKNASAARFPCTNATAPTMAYIICALTFNSPLSSKLNR